MGLGGIFQEITDERERQDKKFPGQWESYRNSFACGGVLWRDAARETGVILGEEFGEVCHAINENDDDNLREELIQVAAVAVAMVEALDG